MRKRFAFKNTGILFYLKNKLHGILFWLKSADEFAISKKLKRIEGSFDPKGTWENIFGIETLQEQKKPPITQLLCLELKEFDKLSDDQISALFGIWKEQIKAGHIPSFPHARRSLGQSAQGLAYIPRPEQEAALKTALQEQGSVHLLVAPRRTGKTSLMKELRSQLSKENEKAIYLNLENEKHAPYASFLARLHTEIDQPEHGSAADMFAQYLSAYHQKISNTEQVNIEAVKTALSELLENATRCEIRILMLDEIVMFCEALDKGSSDSETSDKIFQWLNTLFSVCEKNKISLLLSGSSPLDGYLKKKITKEQQDDLNWDTRVQRHRLRPIEAKENDWYLLLMSFGLVPDESDMEWIADHLDLAMPYQAKLWIASLADGFENYVNGTVTPQSLNNSLQTFFKHEAFADLNAQLESLYAEHIGSLQEIQQVIFQVVQEEKEKNVLLEILQSSSTKAEEILNAILDILPFEETDPRDQKTTIRCVSRMFSGWWKAMKGGV